MGPSLTSCSTIEVNGETMRAMVEGLSELAPAARRILAKHGVDHPIPGHWYPQQAWLDAFREIAETLGPNTLFRIGLKILDLANFPPEIHTVEQALASIDVAYRMNHRGGEIGSYDFERTGPCSGKVVCRNPYPSDFDRGIIQGVAHRFMSESSRLAVHLDYTAPTRKAGGDSCTYLVNW